MSALDRRSMLRAAFGIAAAAACGLSLTSKGEAAALPMMRQPATDDVAEGVVEKAAYYVRRRRRRPRFRIVVRRRRRRRCWRNRRGRLVCVIR